MQVDRGVRSAFIAGCAALALGGAGFRVALGQLQVYLRKESVSLREPLDSLPAALGSWKQIGKDSVFSDALIEELGTQNYLDRFYAIDGDPAKGLMQVHAAYYTGMIDAVPHIPERCWNANGLVMTGQPMVRPVQLSRNGWDEASGPVQPGSGERYALAEVRDPITRKTEMVSMPLGKMEMTVTAFQDPRNPKATALGGYLFIANGAVTPSAMAVRNLSFKLSDRYAYYCKLQFSAQLPGGPDDVLPQFDRMTAELLDTILPHLMRCLPDWPAIERGDTASTNSSPKTN
ncbi:MAG: exosortase-associated EpsI family protein [Planctomycetes bacterium]|nr:exosortase-associated EpsI family protein [Planctomycetota bacterium]